MSRIARGEVDHHHPAHRFRVSLRQFLSQRQARKRLLATRLRQPDDRHPAMNRQSTGKSRAESNPLEQTRRRIDVPEIPRPRIEQPDFSVVNSGRMRHRESGRHHLIRGDIQHRTTTRAAGPPAIEYVGLAADRHVSRPTVLERQPVEMTAVLGRQFRHKRRRPERLETVRAANGTEAAK